ncbi:membrane progestin receptor beta [Patella vulgata]|uniref:membrane progestin receptor beta n=1 Tax=Patella vulgata TaxID=6465 RepID=UPI00217F5C88|nr:membrane progestin receptor beta [Patella vulgata]
MSFIGSTIGLIRHYLCIQKTVSAKSLPVQFREPYILTGYRLPNKTWSYYIISLFQWHNETINVWTHLIACIFVLAELAMFGLQYDLFGNKDGGALLAFGLSSIVMFLISSMSHLLHLKSIKVHYILSLADYAGISLYGSGAGIATFYSSARPEVYQIMAPYYIIGNVFVGWLVYATCVIAKLKFVGPHQLERKLLQIFSFTIQGAWILIPILSNYFHCFMDEKCSFMDLNHMTMSFFLCLVEAVAFAAHIPERYRPKMFDYVGHGHQIFHLLCIYSIIYQMRSVDLNIKRGLANHTRMNINDVLIGFSVLILSQIITTFSILGLVDKKVKEIAKKH